MKQKINMYIQKRMIFYKNILNISQKSTLRNIIDFSYL